MVRQHFFIVCVCIVCVVNETFGDAMHRQEATDAQKEDEGERMARVKRGLPFLKGSGNGYIVAVALPIAVGDRHVFQAFNFEVHYTLANNDTFSPTQLKNRWQGKRSIDDDDGGGGGGGGDVDETLTKNEIPQNVEPDNGSLFSRKNVYRILESNLFKIGLNGTACLLKTICETSKARVYENNGIFGNLFHIMFTPSSSANENLPAYFYEAENMGHATGKCNGFSRYCSTSLLEMASSTMLSRMN